MVTQLAAAGGHHGRAHDLTGPERISVREQVRLIGETLGEPVRFEEVTSAQAREILHRQGGWAAASADFLTGFEAYSPNSVSELTVEEWDATLTPLPTVEEVTGRPARTYAQWVRDNIDEFR